MLFHHGHKPISPAMHRLDVPLHLPAIAQRLPGDGNTPFQGGVADAPFGPQVSEQLMA
jgi:hypothetical protein